MAGGGKGGAGGVAWATGRQPGVKESARRGGGRRGAATTLDRPRASLTPQRSKCVCYCAPGTEVTGRAPHRRLGHAPADSGNGVCATRVTHSAAEAPPHPLPRLDRASQGHPPVRVGRHHPPPPPLCSCAHLLARERRRAESAHAAREGAPMSHSAAVQGGRGGAEVLQGGSHR